MRNIHTTQKGFTLIELLAVIGIIGVLVTVTIVALNPFGQINKARDAQRKSDLKQIQTSLELYYQDNDAYPLDVSWMTDLVNGKYLPKPLEDKAAPSKVYHYEQSGTGYYLFASLDNDNDTQKCTSSGTPCNDTTKCGTGGACTYGVSSSNLSP